jgi:tRNA G18 (ribose-2'-O)-methylase SpoU
VPVVRLDTGAPTWVEDARLASYRGVRDPELVRRSARFIAEGRQVVRTLLTDSVLQAESVLIDDTAWPTLASDLEAAGELAVYRVPTGALRDVAGWKFHQGCLAVGLRPDALSVEALLSSAGEPALLVALDSVSNPDNVGAIFRSASALGAGGVVLGPTCVSPLYRKALRSSMGAALRIPFSHGPLWHEGLAALKAHGYTLLALTPGEGAVSLEALAERLEPQGRYALLLGAEGPGLGATSLEASDQRIVIPMHAGVDSLNVAAAAAVALYRIGQVIRRR